MVRVRVKVRVRVRVRVRFRISCNIVHMTTCVSGPLLFFSQSLWS